MEPNTAITLQGWIPILSRYAEKPLHCKVEVMRTINRLRYTLRKLEVGPPKYVSVYVKPLADNGEGVPPGRVFLKVREPWLGGGKGDVVVELGDANSLYRAVHEMISDEVAKRGG